MKCWVSVGLKENVEVKVTARVKVEVQQEIGTEVVV